MNALFFKITPSGSISDSTPIGTSPSFEFVDSYNDFLDSNLEGGNSPIIQYQYNEETKELLVWDNPFGAGVPA